MGAQSLGSVELACQFGFGQRRMNLVVTYLMDQHRRPTFATLQLWNQMMVALLDRLRDGAQAQGADRIGV